MFLSLHSHAHSHHTHAAPPLPALVTLPTLTITNESPRETLVFTPPTSPVAISSLMYRWEKLEDEQWTPLSYNSGKYTKTHSGHLVINDISFMDAGSYRVIISNDYGSSIQTRQVEVSPKPTPGEPVHIGFTFTLPNSISCIEVKVRVYNYIAIATTVHEIMSSSYS